MTDPSSHTLNYVEKVKIRIGDLRLGMYVCELDRPWLETPFLFQGFELKTEADIDAVRKYCEYVYIDLLRTRTVEITLDAAPPPRSFFNEAGLKGFEQEVEKAETARERTSNLVKSFIDDVRFGNSLDVHLAKAAVSECVAGIMRNPDALMFISQMRERDENLCQHAFNVCVYAIMLGNAAGVDVKELENLGTCGLLHDIGKVSISDNILSKQGPLTDEEFAIVQQHTALGRDILMSGRNVFSGTVDVAYGHHENVDGTGYPRGLEGHQLNMSCKIVAIVEKYDALVSPRPFRPAYNHLDAIDILNQMATKKRLDPALTTAFINAMGIYPPGSVVELSTGEIAIVLQSNPKQRLRPQILTVRDATAKPVEMLVDMALKNTDDRGRPFRIKAVRRPDDFGINLNHYRSTILHSLC